MNNLNLFENLPEGFRLVENEIDHKLTSLTVTQAFADYKYPVPSLPASHSSYMKIFNDFSEAWINNAQNVGLVLTNDDYSAVMILTPVDRSAEIDVVELGNKLAGLESREVGDNLTKIMQYIEKDEEDFKFRDGTVYIEAFAVQTPRQGQKLASKLMRQLFKELDEQDRDVFLFTNTERNAAIYTHFGFETIKKHTVEEINSTTWFMLRKAEKE